MKLELKHLAPYLPFKLNCLNQNLPDTEMVVEELIGISNHITWSGVFNAKYGSNHVPICGIKPILRPLSDLTKNIDDNNNNLTYAAFLKLWVKSDVDYVINIPLSCYYNTVEQLFKWHFDVFGLIEKGLAIDINTL